MRRLLMTALCLLALPAMAADEASLRGQWEVRAPNQPKYVGTVLIDTAGRATWDSPSDRGKPARFIGYIALREGPKIEVLFTNRQDVARMHCTRQSAALLHCYNVLQSGTPSDGFILAKIGEGPESLMPAPR